MTSLEQSIAEQAVEYANLDDCAGRLADLTDVITEALADQPELRPQFACLVPSAITLRRRLLVLASALGRFTSTASQGSE